MRKREDIQYFREGFLKSFAVNNDTGCWEWKGVKDKDGYGKLRISGSRKRMLAHRRSYELFIGTIPEKMCVLHSCDNPPCVNPDRFFLGTSADNTKDCIKKGRHITQQDYFNPRGSTNGAAKLTEDKVIEIRSLISRGNLSLGEIGKKFGVSKTTIADIKYGINWSWLT